MQETNIGFENFEEDFRADTTTSFIRTPAPIKEALNNDEYIWYKLCCYYYAKTEKFDRFLTNLRSPHDPTEAYVTGDVVGFSRAYALKLWAAIDGVRRAYGLNCDLIRFRDKGFSAQYWIDEYNRLVKNGEMDTLEKHIKMFL